MTNLSTSLPSLHTTPRSWCSKELRGQSQAWYFLHPCEHCFASYLETGTWILVPSSPFELKHTTVRCSRASESLLWLVSLYPWISFLSQIPASFKHNAHVQQISWVSFGSRPFQLESDLVKTVPTLSAVKSGRFQYVVFVATESVTVAPSFTVVLMNFFARIWLNDMMRKW